MFNRCYKQSEPSQIDKQNRKQSNQINTKYSLPSNPKLAAERTEKKNLYEEE